MKYLKDSFVVSALLLSIGSHVQAVDLPHTFVAGSNAVAAEVNANFNTLATAITNLQAELTAAKDRITVLEQQLSGTANFLSLKDAVALVDDPYISGRKTVRFSGVNVQIVNGMGSQSTLNGLGNLIVGYNEDRDTGSIVCSKGQWIDESSCISAGGVWAFNHKSGSHNIVGGVRNAYSSHGGLVVGNYNVINNEFTTVSGGTENISSAPGSSVLGGFQEVAIEFDGTIPPIPLP